MAELIESQVFSYRFSYGNVNWVEKKCLMNTLTNHFNSVSFVFYYHLSRKIYYLEWQCYLFMAGEMIKKFRNAIQGRAQNQLDERIITKPHIHWF